jgi:hypothetical protein
MNQNLTLNSANLSDVSGKYYLSVFALTPKTTTTENDTQNQAGQAGIPMQTVSPLYIYLPFIIFFLLFIAAFGILTMNRIWNLKRSITSLVVALIIASIPYIVSTIQNGVGFQSNASPNEIPRNIRVVKNINNAIVIMWDTDVGQIGAIRYNYLPLSNKPATILIESNGLASKIHAIKIADLIPGQYILEIFSGNHWYDNHGIPLQFNVEK